MLNEITCTYSTIPFEDGTFFSQQTFQVTELVKTWIINGFAIQLFRQGPKIYYETVKIDTGRLVVHCILPYNGCADKIIEGFKRRHPLLMRNGEVDFSPHYNTWKIHESAAALVKYNNDLIWNIFSSVTRDNIAHSFKDITIASKRCHPATVDFIESLKTADIREVGELLAKEFVVTRILDVATVKKEAKRVEKFKETFHTKESDAYADSSSKKSSLFGFAGGWLTSTYLLQSVPAISAISSELGTIAYFSALGTGWGAFIVGGCAAAAYYGYTKPEHEGEKALEERTKLPPERPLYLEIEPLSLASRIDKRIRVSKFTWAVMITTGHDGSCGGMHASILIEGIASTRFALGKKLETLPGEYFMCQAHLIAPVHVGLINQNKLSEWFGKGLERSEIWMRPKDKVIRMLAQIRDEEDIQNEIVRQGRDEEIEINKYGSDALGREGRHSCITWVREKLEIADILIPKSLSGPIITISKVYTESLQYYKKYPAIVQI